MYIVCLATVAVVVCFWYELLGIGVYNMWKKTAVVKKKLTKLIIVVKLYVGGR